MEYSAGDHVVYGGTQICTYEKTEEKTFDGVNFREYAVFRPVDQTGNASYFVEKDKVCERVRPLLTKDQVLSQAGTAMLAQANQTSQNVLSLLR